MRLHRLFLGLVAVAPDGTLDSSFGTVGHRTLFLGKHAQFGAVAVDDEGIVGVAGRNGGIQVARWDAGRHARPGVRVGWDRDDPLPAGKDSFPSGHRDRWIGGLAIAETDWGRGFYPKTALLRLTPAGVLDTSFSGDGIARGQGGINVGAAVAIQGDGKLVLSGGQCCGGGSEITYAVARFALDGTPDTAFGGDGTVVTTAPQIQYTGTGAVDVAIQPDGNCVVVGALGYYGGFAAVRFLAS